LQDRMAANTLRTCQSLYQSNSLIPPQVAAHHIAGSLLLLIEWWLNQAMPYPPHQMAKIYERLIANATLNAVQLELGIE